MLQGLLRALLGKLLMNPKTRERIFHALREQARKTDTQLDDAGVDAFETAWDVVVPILVGKL